MKYIAFTFLQHQGLCRGWDLNCSSASNRTGRVWESLINRPDFIGVMEDWRLQHCKPNLKQRICKLICDISSPDLTDLGTKIERLNASENYNAGSFSRSNAILRRSIRHKGSTIDEILKIMYNISCERKNTSMHCIDHKHMHTYKCHSNV